MGLFFKNEICSICGQEMADKKLRDGYICKNCREKSIFNPPSWKAISCQQVRENSVIHIEKKKEDPFAGRTEGYVFSDTINHTFQIYGYDAKFSFDDLVRFEVIENDRTVSLEVFWRDVTDQKQITDLQVKIITENIHYPHVYIPLLKNNRAEADMELYSACYEELRKIQRELTAIMDCKIQKMREETPASTAPSTRSAPVFPDMPLSPEPDSASAAGAPEPEPVNQTGTFRQSGAGFSVADEILKYKALLDQGIITQEEFEFKKKQLLGM